MNANALQNKVEIDALKRRVDRGLDITGNPVVTSGSGTIPAHSHGGTGQGGLISGARVGTFVDFDEVAAPATPSSGRVRVYAKADGHLYQKDDAGTETDLAAAGGSGAVATDTIWDVKGDLAVGTGSNTASRLAAGANDTFLIADSATGTGLKWGTSIAAATVLALTADTVVLQSGPKTYTSTPALIKANTTITLNFVDAGIAMNNMAGTILYQQAGWPGNMYYGYLNNPVIRNAANVQPGPVNSFVDDLTMTVDTNALTCGDWVSFRSHATMLLGTGTLTVTTMSMFRGGFRTIPAGYTITTLKGFEYVEVDTMSGTLPTQIAVDIPRLTKATTNIGIRSASTIQLVDSVGVETANWLASTGEISLGGVRTYTANPTFLDVTPTMTINAVNAGVTAYKVSATVNYQQNGFLSVMFSHGATHKNLSGSNITPPSIIAMNDAGTIQIDGQTKTVVGYGSYRSAPITSRITSGALTVTDMYALKSELSVGLNTTVTTRRALWILDPVAGPGGAGTLTTNIGIDIELQTFGGTDFGVRNASNLVQTGYARFGAITAPANTGSGVVSALRGLFGTDAAFPNANVIFWVNQPTKGNEVFRLTSTAATDDPAEMVFQNEIETTGAGGLTLHTFTIPATTTYMIEVWVVARRTGGAAGAAEDGAGYVVRGTYKNVAGTATIIGALNLDYTAESQAAWNCTLTPSGATVLLQAFGALNNNVRWHVTARVWQVGT